MARRLTTPTEPRTPAPPARPMGADALTDALNAASWAEADLHLARAWREAEAVHMDIAGALAALARRDGAKARPSAARRRLSAALDRAAFAAERIAAVARLRRLARVGAGREPFDPQRHALAPDAAEPARGALVAVKAPAIVRRAGAVEEVLVKALVAAEPVRPAPRASMRATAKRRTRTTSS